MLKKDLITLETLTAEDLGAIFQLTARIKENPKKFKKVLKRRVLAMVFQDPSLMTMIGISLGQT